ncbi:GNAT family N-acetyltransferase [Chloroflexota bacterium]
MLAMREFKVRSLNKQDHIQVVQILENYWGSTDIVTHGTVHNADQLPGFIAIQDNKPVGVLTYQLHNNECEIISLNSLVEGKGIGSALVDSAKNIAITANCKRLWLITTNDNTHSLTFYQKRGFSLAEIYPNALEYSRKLKPEIPMIGINGIPLRDEIELEILF